MTVPPTRAATPVGRRALLQGAAAVALSGAGVIGMSGCQKNPSASAENGFAAGDGTFTHIDPASRAAAPTLAGPTLDGARVSSADDAGRIVVVNGWGSWCNPCRHEAPALEKAAKALAGTAAFLGLNTRDLSPAPAQAFVRTFGISYPSIYDPHGSLLLGFGQVPPKAIPSTIIIDAQGRVAGRFLGEVDASTLVAEVHDVAAGR